MLQALITQKAEKEVILTATLEAGESLFPSTSSEGREELNHEMNIIRQRSDNI